MEAQLKKVIFIAGIATRSGTNYIGRMLLNHPDACRPIGRWEHAILAASEYFVQFYRAYRLRAGDREPRTTLQEFGHMFGPGYQNYLESLVKENKEANHLILKYPSSVGVGNFNLFFPDGKLIILIRDYKDILTSWLSVGEMLDSSLSKDRITRVVSLSRGLNRRAKEILDLRTSKPSRSSLMIRYEDLNARPVEALERIARFTGLEPAQEWLQESLNMTVKGSTFYRETDEGAAELPSTGKASWKDHEKTENFQPVGRSKKHLNAMDKAILKALGGSDEPRLIAEAEKDWLTWG